MPHQTEFDLSMFLSPKTKTKTKSHNMEHVHKACIKNPVALKTGENFRNYVMDRKPDKRKTIYHLLCINHIPSPLDQSYTTSFGPIIYHLLCTYNIPPRLDQSYTTSFGPPIYHLLCTYHIPLPLD